MTGVDAADIAGAEPEALGSAGAVARHRWMPEFRPPWHEDRVRGDGERVKVRPEYRQGLWAYAVGRPACEHPKYGKAVDAARKARWSPWWIRNHADVEAVLAGCWFDKGAARWTVEFLETLTLSKGEWGGQPFVPMDWQRYDFVGPLYGWRSPDGLRRFTRAGIWIPKKNAKSGSCSGLGIYHLVGDGENTPHVWVAASDRKQAGIVHDESSRMVKKSGQLSEIIKPIDSKKRLVCQHNGGIFEALSADVESWEGLDWSAGLVDELHVGVRKMFSTLSGGGAARRQPLLMSISTAGVYDPLSIGWEQWEYCGKVLDGSLRDVNFMGLRYCGDEGEGWDSEENIQRANPSYGLTCKKRFIQERLTEARTSEAKKGEFWRYHLNIWVNAAHRWMPAADWDNCAEAFEPESLEGRVCYGGLDLSLSNDLTAFVLAFPPVENDPFYRQLEWFFLPEDNIAALEQESHAPYRDWQREGWIDLTPGNTVDYQVVREIIEECCVKYQVQGVFYDPNNANETSIALRESRGDEFAVEHRQGMVSMAPPTKQFEGLIRTGKLRHRGSPVMAWQVSNCQAVYNRQGDYMLTKGEISARGRGRLRYKIDGVVASVMAVGQAVAKGGKTAESVYATRGMLVLGGD